MTDFLRATAKLGAIAALLMGSLVMASCTSDEAADETEMSSVDLDEAECGAAFVDFVSIEQNEDDDYFAVVQGHYPSACDELSKIAQTVDGDAITIFMCSVRPPDVACAQQLTPFEEHLPIDTADLDPGEYTVQVNDATGDKSGTAATLTIQ